MPTAPASWAVPALRACNVCMHGRCAAGRPTRPGGAGAAGCTSPEVTGRHGAVMPVQAARGEAGPCGPEARFQHWPAFTAPMLPLAHRAAW